jgi:hypothetical protein
MAYHPFIDGIWYENFEDSVVEHRTNSACQPSHSLCPEQVHYRFVFRTCAIMAMRLTHHTRERTPPQAWSMGSFFEKVGWRKDDIFVCVLV